MMVSQYLPSSDIFPTARNFFENHGNGALIDRSTKCELLVSAKDGKVMPAQCKFCQKASTDVKGEATIDHTDRFEADQKVKEEQVEFDNDAESTHKSEECSRSNEDVTNDTNSLSDGMRLRRVALWKYFTEKDDDTAACTDCGTELRAHKLGRTANLVRDDILSCREIWRQ